MRAPELSTFEVFTDSHARIHPQKRMRATSVETCTYIVDVKHTVKHNIVFHSTGEQCSRLPGLHAGRMRAEEGAPQLPDLLSLLHAGGRPELLALGAVQEGRGSGPSGRRQHPRGANRQEHRDLPA